MAKLDLTKYGITGTTEVAADSYPMVVYIAIIHTSMAY